jgi:transposase
MKSLELQHTIRLIHELDAEIDEVETTIKEIMDELVPPILTIPGISYRMGAMILAEIGDFSRFASPRALMSYVGLVPSESSSGETTSRGRITKTGNSHVRRLLVEAAWHHARPLSPASETDVASSAGLPAEAAGIAARANRRLHRRYLDLRARGKGANVTNVAVAREIVGFCWALALCG